MADVAITFGADDVFLMSGVDSRFISQNRSDDDQGSYAIVQGLTGDELTRSAAFDNRNEATATYRWNGTTSLGTKLPPAGKVLNGYVLTSFVVASSNDDFPTLTVMGHKHDSNSHVDTMTQYTMPAAVIAVVTGAFGAYDILDGTDTTAVVANSSYTLECDHEDVNGATGEHLVGHNYNGRHSVSQVFNGTPNAIDTLSAWSITSTAIARDNQGHLTTSYAAEAGITADT